MHTFFVNTSKKTLDDYNVLLDIYEENQNLVSMNCPIGEWHDPVKGYVGCAHRMGELIDGYVDINNEYNLILYIDLAEIDSCPSIPRDANHETERTSHVEALRRMYCHVMDATMIAALKESGRTPRNVLIMFGRDRFFVGGSDEEKSPDQLQEAKMNAAQIRLAQIRLLGLSDIDKIKKTVGDIVAGGGTEEEQQNALEEQLPAICGYETVAGLRKYYAEALKEWCCQVIGCKSQSDKSISSANEALCVCLDTIYINEGERERIWTVMCPYDVYACKVNQSEMALSRLNIALHLLECVERNSVLEKQDSGDTSRPQPLTFHAYTLEEVTPLLKKREGVYFAMREKVHSWSYEYSKLKLAPPLKAFDHRKFDLDEYGGQEIVSDDERARGNGPLLTENELRLMQDTVTEVTPPPDATPEQYKACADRVKKGHLNYLRKLKNHVIEALSSYARFGEDHRPPVLRTGGFRYAEREHPPANGGNDAVPLGVAKETSQRAYETVLNRYAEFCASRTVAVTDVEEQCEWFKNRVDDIEESLRKLRAVAFCMAIALLGLYIPFIVIQFEAIVQNVLTLAVAMASMAVPQVLLFSVFTVLSIRQRKKYADAWGDFQKASNDAIEANRHAVADFDHLLSTAIPALRWVYEYKLDVAYCEECCQVAAAKIEHHLIKLRARVDAIRNMLIDLEDRPYDHGQVCPGEEAGEANIEDMELSRSFCTGKNKDFYMILDTKLLATIKRKERKQI